MVLIPNCKMFPGYGVDIDEDCVISTTPIQEFAIEELRVTEPLGETGIPVADSVIIRIVCKLNPNCKPLKKIFFYKPNQGYSWSYENLFNFQSNDSLKNLSFEEKIAFIKERFPIDSSKMGSFEIIPLKFKTGVWYSFTGLDITYNGVYDVLFDKKRNPKVVYSTGPW